MTSRARPLSCATRASARSSAPSVAALHWVAASGVVVDEVEVDADEIGWDVVEVGATLRWWNMGLTTFSCTTTAPRVEGRIR